MRGTVGLVVAIATLALAGSANAARVGIAFYSGEIPATGGYLIDYIADPGEVNQPTATVTGAGTATVVTVHDPVATISPEPPTPDEQFQQGFVFHGNWSACTLLDPHTAKCVVPDPTIVANNAENPSFGLIPATEGTIAGIGLRLGDRNDTYAPPVPSLGEEFTPVQVWGGDGNDRI